ncbi:MAG: hypothetical protein D6753_13860 [Planctomycetota bacterium]|nr:MAG: hypothetical protein D6753_13860 [Planctomycetota bacterium]
MQLLPCASCGKIFVLPEGTSAAATIECPNCEQQYVVDSLVRDELVRWKVVYDPNSPDAPADVEILAVEEEASDVAGDGAQQAPLVLDGAIGSGAGSALRRARRKQGTPIWSIIQVVLGGVAAVPIALLILWWVLDRDVMDAGPKVARYLPWIVPQKYHPFDGPDADVADTLPRRPQRRGQSGFRRFDDVFPIDGGDSSAPGSDPRAAESGGTTTHDAPEIDPPNADQTARETASPAEDGTVFGLARRCLSELDAFLQASERGNEAVSSASADDSEPSAQEPQTTADRRRELAQRAYATLMELARAVEDIPLYSPVRRPVEDLLEDIARRIGQHPELRRLVQQGATYWEAGAAPGGHLALVGTVVDVQPLESPDSAVMVHLATDGVPESVSRIFVPSRWAIGVEPDNDVFVLGRRIEADAAEPENSATERIATQSGERAPENAGFEACYLQVLQP